jgi:hypothetical protein
MNKELATVLRNKLAGLPFVDLLAGMAQTLTVADPNQDDQAPAVITKRYPVSYDTTGADACAGVEIPLMPDGSRKSIIYFEDYGIAVTGRLHGLVSYSSNVRLICWLNRANLVGDHYTEISGRCMAAIVDTLLTKNPENIGMFTRLAVNVARIPPQDAALFGKYTYDETTRQYLRPPFEFFGIDLTATYQAPAQCLNGINWNQQLCT